MAVKSNRPLLMMDRNRLKLFRLLSYPLPPDPIIYIPDCLGQYSPFLDPLHDNFGREYVTCFLIDKNGKVAMFLNRWYFDYVPYNILFNLNEYNRCLKLLFCEDVVSENFPINEQFSINYENVVILNEYAEGSISIMNALSLLKKGYIFECIGSIFRLLRAYYLLQSEKRFLQYHLKQWKKFKIEYQRMGIYVFVAHPKLKKLIKIFSPNKNCDREISTLVEKVGQKIPLSFSSTKYIDSEYLQRLWISQIRQDRSELG